MNIYKYVALIVTVLIGIVFQPTLLARLSLPGATPDLVLVIVCCWAITKGPAVGAIAGFIAGLFLDVVPPGNNLIGVASIFLALIGYAIGIAGSGPSRSVVRPLLISGIGATTFFLFRTIWALISGSDITLYNFSVNFITQGIYAAALAIFIYPGITFLDRKLGPVSRADELRMQ
ncbi:MAG: rod shape-determining protein MreD [Actinomycetota bacterium]|jgi:rod shape-determining protein MreD